MKTATQYRDDIKTLTGKIADLDAKCIAESRDLSDEEVDLRDRMMDKVDGFRKMVASIERSQKINDELAKPTREVVSKPLVDTMTQKKQEARDSFGSFGGQMAAIMRAGMPGGVVDPRLRNTRAVTGMSEGIPSDGGFLVQQDFSSELLKQVWETGKLASLCRRITVSGNANSIKINGFDETSRVAGSRQGGVRGYWLEEAGEKTASKPTFRKIELNLSKLIGLCYLTDELMEDVSLLEKFVTDAFTSEFGFMIDDAICSGNGVGQPLGYRAGGGFITTSAEPGQAANSILAENIFKMHSRLLPSAREKSCWLINSSCEEQLHTMSISVGTGGIPVYMPANGMSGKPFATLLGHDVHVIEQAEQVGTLGDISLCNFQDGYVLATKGSIKKDMSIHCRYIFDESVIRLVTRIDGQPVLATDIDAFKGGSTHSKGHFVVLETRS